MQPAVPPFLVSSDPLRPTAFPAIGSPYNGEATGPNYKPVNLDQGLPPGSSEGNFIGVAPCWVLNQAPASLAVSDRLLSSVLAIPYAMETLFLAFQLLSTQK